MPNTLRHTLHSDDAEQAVLGACLLDRDAIPKARAVLRTDDFYRVGNRHVFDALCTMFDDGEIPEALSLAAHLEAAGQLAQAGGREYLGFLCDVTPFSETVVQHARIVRERADARALLAICRETAAQLVQGEKPAELAQHVASEVLPIAVSRVATDFRTSRDVVFETLEAIEAKAQGRGVPSIRTGYHEIDTALAGGFEPGELAFLCAAPGGCKTALALNIATNVALDDRIGAAVVSAEMGRKANMQRILSRLSGVPAKKIREATGLDHDDFARLTRASGAIAHAPLWIDDTTRPAMRQIEAKARRLKALHPTLRLLVVDFIQLLELEQKRSGKSEDNRALELTKIAYSLKHLSKEIDVATIATAQVDAAAVEKRSDKRPLLSDIRWSQGIRESADFVGMLFRPRAYDPGVSEDTLEVRFDKARDLEPFTATLVGAAA
jgi:replicative DNA helicase